LQLTYLLISRLKKNDEVSDSGGEHSSECAPFHWKEVQSCERATVPHSSNSVLNCQNVPKDASCYYTFKFTAIIQSTALISLELDLQNVALNRHQSVMHG
jgi:hypothetical protein